MFIRFHMRSYCVRGATLLLAISLLASCASSGPESTRAFAQVSGVASNSGGAPLIDFTVRIACDGGAPTILLSTDSLGRYQVGLVSGEDPFAGSQGEIRCLFRAPATGTVRIEVDTVLAFYLPTELIPSQTVDLHEP